MLGGVSYVISAEMSSIKGPFPRHEQNKDNMLRVIEIIEVHLQRYDEEYEGLTVKPRGIDPNYCPEYLIKSAQECWDQALSLGEKHGFEMHSYCYCTNWHYRLIMDCDTTGIEPDFALVKFKTLAGGGMLRIINQSVPPALDRLGYSEKQVDDIIQ